jgi:hypothetical protein
MWTMQWIGDSKSYATAVVSSWVDAVGAACRFVAVDRCDE